MLSKPYLRRLSVADVGQVADLHRDYYPYRNAEILKWQFFDPDLPCESVIMGVFDGAKLVGSQGFIPVNAWWEGKEILACQSELTLLLPPYRGGDIFKKLYNAGIERCEQEGFACVFGFTTAVKPFASVGFDILEPWYLELLVLNPVRFLTSMLNKRNGWVPPPALPAYDVPQELMDAKDGTFGLRRDHKYIKHWYVNNPNRFIVYFDRLGGVLYTAGYNKSVVFISEITRLELLEASVKRAVKGRRRQWVSLCRKTNHPSLGAFSIPGAIRVVRHRGNLIFRWIGTFRRYDTPKIFSEEGYVEVL